MNSISATAKVPIVTSNLTTGHFRGGLPSAPQAVCPNCDLQLTRFFSFAPTFAPIFENVKAVELLYCWQCALPEANFSYELTSAGIRIIEVKDGPRQEDFPYEEYPRWFPETSVHLTDMDPALETNLKEFHRISTKNPEIVESKLSLEKRLVLETPRHQLGGTPFLYEEAVPECKLCQDRMLFLATVANEAGNASGFFGNDYVQVVYFVCQTCLVLTARQECD